MIANTVSKRRGSLHSLMHDQEGTRIPKSFHPFHETRKGAAPCLGHALQRVSDADLTWQRQHSPLRSREGALGTAGQSTRCCLPVLGTFTMRASQIVIRSELPASPTARAVSSLKDGGSRLGSFWILAQAWTAARIWQKPRGFFAI